MRQCAVTGTWVADPDNLLLWHPEPKQLQTHTHTQTHSLIPFLSSVQLCRVAVVEHTSVGLCVILTLPIQTRSPDPTVFHLFPSFFLALPLCLSGVIGLYSFYYRPSCTVLCVRARQRHKKGDVMFVYVVPCSQGCFLSINRPTFLSSREGRILISLVALQTHRMTQASGRFI